MSTNYTFNLAPIEQPAEKALPVEHQCRRAHHHVTGPFSVCMDVVAAGHPHQARLGSAGQPHTAAALERIIDLLEQLCGVPFRGDVKNSPIGVDDGDFHNDSSARGDAAATASPSTVEDATPPSGETGVEGADADSAAPSTPNPMDETDKRDRVDHAGCLWEWSQGRDRWEHIGGEIPAKATLEDIARGAAPLAFADEEKPETVESLLRDFAEYLHQRDRGTLPLMRRRGQ